MDIKGAGQSVSKLHWREPVGIALGTLSAHKLRSFLTLLGVILSVSTLVGVISIIRGMDIYIADRVANMGANVFLVRQMGFITNAKDFMEALRKNRRISWEDYAFLRDNMKLAQAVGVEVRRNGKSRYGGETL